MQKYLIIVAGGSGSRMGTALPKQFIVLKNRPILMHTMDVFFQYDPTIIMVLVLPENQFEYWEELKVRHSFHLPHVLVKGGKERFFSVRNGLHAIPSEGLVAIHDAVRPLVRTEVIDRCFVSAENYGTAIPVVSVKDSVRVMETENSRPMDRSLLKLVQTPQVFYSREIKRAYENEFHEYFTDDASVYESFCGSVHLVEGNQENIKLTYPEDLIFAEAVMSLNHQN